MRTTRRRFVQGTLAATALSGAPGIVRAQAPSRARTIRAVMQGDLRSLDPIWTTANITAYHGAMIYDTLFALDGEQRHAAADGRQVRRVGRQAHPHVRAARRTEILRRQRPSPPTTWSPRSAAGRRATAAAST